MDTTRSTVMPTLRYRDAHAAIDWLSNVLGFSLHASYPGPNNTVGHAELTLNTGMIMLGSEKDDEYGKGFTSPPELGNIETSSTYVVVKDDEYGKGFKSPAELGNIETRSTYVVVKDVEAVYNRAQSSGTQIVRPLHTTDYASQEFTVKDPEGHSWTIGTYDPWATPAM